MEEIPDKFIFSLRNKEKLGLRKSLYVFTGFLVILLIAVFLGGEKELRNKETNIEKESLFLSSQFYQDSYPEPSFIQNNCLIGFSPSFQTDSKALLSYGGAEESRDIMEYIVQEGENLSLIAEKFKVSVQTIAWANDISNSFIKPGQKLIILPVSGVIHLVRSGDILSKIAQTYKTEEKDIVAFNDISDDKIYIGDILVIPGGEKSSVIGDYSIPLASSYFIFPCKGTISQRLHWYNAIDIANECGTPIYAAAEGTIQKAGWSGIGGNFVRVIHPNNVVTYYGHLSKILVGIGQKVSQGSLIGYMGATGQATGCHVHFDVIGAKNPLSGYLLGTYLGWK